MPLRLIYLSYFIRIKITSLYLFKNAEKNDTFTTLLKLEVTQFEIIN